MSRPHLFAVVFLFECQAKLEDSIKPDHADFALSIALAVKEIQCYAAHAEIGTFFARTRSCLAKFIIKIKDSCK